MDLRCTSQGATGLPRVEEARTDSLPEPSEGCGPTRFLTLDSCLQNCERINAYYLKPPSLWSFAPAAVETIKGRKTVFSFRRNWEGRPKPERRHRVRRTRRLTTLQSQSVGSRHLFRSSIKFSHFETGNNST